MLEDITSQNKGGEQAGRKHGIQRWEVHLGEWWSEKMAPRQQTGEQPIHFGASGQRGPLSVPRRSWTDEIPDVVNLAENTTQGFTNIYAEPEGTENQANEHLTKQDHH
jgi:hypothetical protein